MKKVIGYVVLGLGLYLFANDHLLWGLVLFFLGGIVAKGTLGSGDGGASFGSDTEIDSGCDGGD